MDKIKIREELLEILSDATHINSEMSDDEFIKKIFQLFCKHKNIGRDGFTGQMYCGDCDLDISAT